MKKKKKIKTRTDFFERIVDKSGDKLSSTITCENQLTAIEYVKVENKYKMVYEIGDKAYGNNRHKHHTKIWIAQHFIDLHVYVIIIRLKREYS